MEIKYPTLLSPHAKMRRLAYVRDTVEILGASKRIEKSIIRELEDQAGGRLDQIGGYPARDGEMSRGTFSAGRYITLASMLGFVSGAERGSRRITKYGEVLKCLDRNDNPFFLSDEEICVFLWSILLKDSDGIVPLLKALSDGPWGKREELSGCFLKHYKSRLDQLSESRGVPFSVREEYKKRRNKINDWGSPRKYVSESLVSTRMGWLFDMKIVGWKKYREGKYSLSDAGEVLLSSLPWRESDGGKFRTVDEDWISESFYRTLSKMFGLERKSKVFKELTPVRREKIILSQLDDAIANLPARPMNKIRANQFLLLCCTRLLLKKNIIVEFEEVKNTLNRLSGSRDYSVQFRWEGVVNDGYILLKE